MKHLPQKKLKALPPATSPRTCVMAARCMDPSGFFTILMGLISTPALLVWPCRNAGSLSFRSISNSSSTCGRQWRGSGAAGQHVRDQVLGENDHSSAAVLSPAEGRPYPTHRITCSLQNPQRSPPPPQPPHRRCSAHLCIHVGQHAALLLVVARVLRGVEHACTERRAEKRSQSDHIMLPQSCHALLRCCCLHSLQQGTLSRTRPTLPRHQQHSALHGSPDLISCAISHFS